MRSCLCRLLCSAVACISILPACPPVATGGDHDQDAAAMTARVDELLAAEWERRGVQPAPLASDAAFLRRVTLDLTGVIPTVSETRAFLESSAGDKRKLLIQRLLASPRYATHMAHTWRTILLPDGVGKDVGAAAAMQDWLRRRFAENLRFDRLVGDFLTVTGSDDTGPVVYYEALELKPEKLAADTARNFLGIRLACAQCHDHPFDKWTQADFWSYAAFFAQVRQDRGSNRGRLYDAADGEVRIPEHAETVDPRFLDGTVPAAAAAGARRLQLSIWIASRNNPYLARATVNRMWSQLFGRGIVNPVDDVGHHNPPTQPELLQELSDYFVRSGFDLRDLLGVLAQTRAYQLSSRPGTEASSRTGEEAFAVMALKPLTAEQLYDSLVQCMLFKMPARGLATSSNAVQNRARQSFVQRTRTATPDATEFAAGIPQILFLMNRSEFASATWQARSGLLAALGAPMFSPKDRLDTIFLATLTRFPDAHERHWAEANAPENPTKEQLRAYYEDLLWALINSAEFCLNH